MGAGAGQEGCSRVLSTRVSRYTLRAAGGGGGGGGGGEHLRLQHVFAEELHRVLPPEEVGEVGEMGGLKVRAWLELSVQAERASPSSSSSSSHHITHKPYDELVAGLRAHELALERLSSDAEPSLWVTNYLSILYKINNVSLYNSRRGRARLGFKLLKYGINGQFSKTLLRRDIMSAFPSLFACN